MRIPLLSCTLVFDNQVGSRLIEVLIIGKSAFRLWEKKFSSVSR